jgi:transcriptional repressor NrdR
MRCPSCSADDTKVIDSREAEEGTAIRRRRSCMQCQHRFTTYERLEPQPSVITPLVVIKSTGDRQRFDRVKIVSGVTAATKGRPVSVEQTLRLAEDVEDDLRATAGSAGGEVTSAMIGHAVLDRLRLLDEVAYLRFASVYKAFDGAADFRRELVLLEKLSATPASADPRSFASNGSAPLDPHGPDARRAVGGQWSRR